MSTTWLLSLRCRAGERVFAFSPHVRVYLASQPVDMRAGHDGLFAIIKSWDLNPFSGDLFAFIGKRGDRAKVLTWHRGGFILMYKRLEKGKFRIPTIAPGTRTAMLDATELAMLLDGIDVTRVKRPALWELPSIAR
jgi:transposase